MSASIVGLYYGRGGDLIPDVTTSVNVSHLQLASVGVSGVGNTQVMTVYTWGFNTITQNIRSRRRFS